MIKYSCATRWAGSAASAVDAGNELELSAIAYLKPPSTHELNTNLEPISPLSFSTRIQSEDLTVLAQGRIATRTNVL